MRIVTRPDFDGVVCAVLLYDVLDISEPIAWVEPSELQKREVVVKGGDILANLPFHENCALWFDHHHSNRIDTPFEGLFRVAPSAAGLIHEHYKTRFSRDFSELVAQTDKIDSADLSRQEVLYPEEHPYLLLSMTIVNHDRAEAPYWNLLVELLGRLPIDRVMAHEAVQARCRRTIEENRRFAAHLKNHTVLYGHVAVTDFRPLGIAPTGNRFLAYSLFPEAVVSVKVRHPDGDRGRVVVSVGHSIFNRGCNVNVGEMLSRFEGGGHRGAGACTFSADKAEDYIPRILEILVANEKNDAL